MASSLPTVNDGIARVTRTGVFAGTAEIVIQFIEAFIKDLNEAQHVAALGMLTLIINALVVIYEHSKTKGLFLRDLPPTRTTVEGT